MTHLEQKIYDALTDTYCQLTTDGLDIETFERMSRIAAKIALELAEKVYNQGWCDGWYSAKEGKKEDTFKQFIQDYIGS